MKSKSKLFLFSIIISMAVIVYQFLKWEIVDVITPFLLIPLWLLLFGSFVIAAVFSVIRIVKYKDWKPFLVFIVTLLLLVFVPFNKITLNKEFSMHKLEREKVVALVETKQFHPKDSPQSTLITFKLPSQFKNLSKGGGEVLLVKKNDHFSVLFFTYRGILDRFSGFIYTPDNEKPKSSDYGVEFSEIKRMDDHWYFVSA